MTKLAERIIKEKSEEFPHWSRTFNSFMDISYNDVSYRAADKADIWMDTEIILSTDLFYAENLRKMNDGFWFMMSELSTL